MKKRKQKPKPARTKVCWPNLIVAADLFGPARQDGALNELMRRGRLGAVLALDEPQKVRLRELLAGIEPASPGTDGNALVPFLPPRWRLRDVVEVIEKEAPELIPEQYRLAAGVH
ncbi:MAG: hypothetical protein VKI42_08630 [Synechococcaceae cyanobacterium]|nr:hypothetical protein [Synechococcaceae cyanobacterium]